jgi:hypothetical protein
VDLKVEGFLEGSQDILHLLEHTPEFTWIFTDSDSEDSQVSYEIRVGTSPSSSNLWNPGVVDGDANSVVYSGSELVDGRNYYVGIRVFDGQNWSAWNVILFHMNQPPEIAGLSVNGYGEGATGIMEIPKESPLLDADIQDPDGPFAQTKYELRIGSASGLSEIWTSGIMDGTFSEMTYDGPALSDGTTYWFGLRAFDGYEWGEWSEIEFKTNDRPSLDWVGESEYMNDGLDPEEGNSSITFVFMVKYSDPEGHEPESGSPKLHILRWGHEITGGPFPMTYQSGLNIAGAIYSYSTTLTVGVNYSYYFTASDVLGGEALSTDEKNAPVVVDIIPEIPLTPPENVNVGATDDATELRITWEKSTGEDVAGYNIYRSTTSDPSGFVLIDSSGPFATSFTDSDLEEKITYYYMIKTFDSEGNESDYSSQAQGTTISEPEEVEPEQDLCWLYTLIMFVLVMVLIF